jgi:hypothetical protein
VLGVDPDAVVATAELPLGAPMGVDPDHRGAAGVELDRISDQVARHGHQQRAIAADDGQFGDGQRGVGLLEGERQRCARLLDELGGVEQLRLDPAPPHTREESRSLIRICIRFAPSTASSM